MQKFELKRVTEIVPNCGEELGGTLLRLAAAEEARYRAIETASVAHWAGTVAQLLYLGADAFCAGAAASIGHNRSARYEARAAEARRHAEALEAEAKRVRDDHESKKLVAAFMVGYEGGDIKRYAFDDREAAQLGQYFKANELGVPARINKLYRPRPLNRDSERDCLVVDGDKWLVDYPTGNVNVVEIAKLAA